MALVEQASCRIEKLNSKGLGEGYTAKGKVKLPYVIEGELVEFERHLYRGKENFILKNILEASPKRVSPPCPYFTRCGGCSLQHLNNASYLDFKSTLLEGLSAEKIEIISLSNPKRRRLNLFFSNSSKQLYLGFYMLKSDKIVNIDSCVVAKESLTTILPFVRNFLEGFLSLNDLGEIFLLEADNGIEVKIINKSSQEFLEKNRRKLSGLIGKHQIIKVSYIHNQQLIFTEDTEEPFVEFAGIKVSVSADSFLQATKDSDKVLARIVVEALSDNKAKKIADLFCGRGTFTLPLIQEGYLVECFENDKNALLALSKALKGQGHFYLRDLHYKPLDEELDKFEVIVINPPRAGAEEQVKKIVKKDNIKKIIYISCDPESFKRDSKILAESFNLKNIVAVDQFLWSPHLEIVAMFDK